jgi:hypothetical protein
MILDAILPADASVRQAALLLHGMAPGDRTWLLDQLPLEQQEALSTLLVELAELGVPADPAFVRQAVAEFTPVTSRVLDGLTPSQLKALAELLRHEPPALAARLLAAGPWPWEAELLGAMGAAKRRQIEACMEPSLNAGGVGPMLLGAVVDAVTTQLHAPAKGVA